MNKKKYPSIITREQFAKIAPLLESAKNKTSPRTLDLYDVFNAAPYLLKTGLSMAALPKLDGVCNSVHTFMPFAKVS